MADYQLYINSDNSIIIEFSAPITIELTRLILGVKRDIDNSSVPGLIETVPAYNSLLVIFKAEKFKQEQSLKQLAKILESAQPLAQSDSKQHVIPVCYDFSLAPDLEQVAQHCSLDVEEVIKRHSSQEYPVFMLGFLPGFLYLGDLDPALHCPRRDDPRPHIKAGSVGIGGTQTGIYPIDSPGGWQIIGKTPVKLFNASSEPPAIAKPLDTIRFKPISLEEFTQYGD